MKIINRLVLGSLVLGILPLQFNHAAVTSPPKPSAQQTPLKINLNTAAVDSLSHSIKGIGRKRAEAIVRYRQSHGAFQSLRDLAQVPGFSEKFVNSHLDELNNVFTV